MENEGEEWQKLQSLFQGLGEKMLEAGWAKGFTISPDGIVVALTPKGKQRLKEIFGALSELGIQTLTNDELEVLAFLSAREEGLLE